MKLILNEMNINLLGHFLRLNSSFRMTETCSQKNAIHIFHFIDGLILNECSKESSSQIIDVWWGERFNSQTTQSSSVNRKTWNNKKGSDWMSLKSGKIIYRGKRPSFDLHSKGLRHFVWGHISKVLILPFQFIVWRKDKKRCSLNWAKEF